jgi:hypothetical protein
MTSLRQLVAGAPKVSGFVLTTSQSQIGQPSSAANVQRSTYDFTVGGYSNHIAATASSPAYDEVSIGNDLYVRPTAGKWTKIVRGATAFGDLRPVQPGVLLSPLFGKATSLTRIGPAQIDRVATTHFHAVESLKNLIALEAATGSAAEQQALSASTVSGTVTTDMYLNAQGLPVRLVDTEDISSDGQSGTVVTTRVYRRYNTAPRVRVPGSHEVAHTVRAASSTTLEAAVQKALG